MLFDVFKVFLQDYDVIRKGQGHYESGLWVEQESETIVIKGNIQPLESEVLETLPEGYRTRENYVLCTETKLLTSETNKNNPDIVIFDNERYQVAKVFKWGNIKIPLAYFEYLIVKENRDAN